MKRREKGGNGSRMITIVTVDEEILERAARISGIKEKSAVVRRGLECLIAGESAKRLAALGGSEKQLAALPRKQSEAGSNLAAGFVLDPQLETQENETAARHGLGADGGGNGR